VDSLLSMYFFFFFEGSGFKNVCNTQISAGTKMGIYSKGYFSCQQLLWDLNFSYFKG
jgi:hypothetical protein